MGWTSSGVQVCSLSANLKSPKAWRVQRLVSCISHCPTLQIKNTIWQMRMLSKCLRLILERAVHSVIPVHRGPSVRLVDLPYRLKIDYYTPAFLVAWPIGHYSKSLYCHPDLLTPWPFQTWSRNRGSGSMQAWCHARRPGGRKIPWRCQGVWGLGLKA